MARNIPVRKVSLHNQDDDHDLKDKSPDELLGMMWQLALDAWSFEGEPDAEFNLRRDIVVVKKLRD